MILLWGVDDDGPLKAVAEALAERRAPVFFLDQRQAASTEIDSTADERLEGAIRMGAARCDLAAVAAVYLRCHASSTFLDEGADGALVNRVCVLDEALCAFLDATPARVVNPFAAMASNSSKPYQLALIRAHGFAIPDTLVATDPGAVRDFLLRHGEIVYKSVSSERSIVSRLTPAHLDRLDDIRWCPTQFQQYVAGRDHRVHVVGEKVFACEIISEADDYRYAARGGSNVELKACALPSRLAEQCRDLAASLGLAVAGLDLRVTPDGDWHCFEVNPSPAFSYYESATGLPIAEAIADLLIGA
ncbi:MAG TPA: hypothetical protein VMU18_12230 [Rhodoblastus sp.]|nr:hypothetical protein [Rhodoblastus sp.]